MEKALIIIPTYNEAENIKKIIEATIREKKFDVLVVDDSSPDGTATIVKEIIKSYPKKVFLEVKKNKDGLVIIQKTTNITLHHFVMRCSSCHC